MARDAQPYQIHAIVEDGWIASPPIEMAFCDDDEAVAFAAAHRNASQQLRLAVS